MSELDKRWSIASAYWEKEEGKWHITAERNELIDGERYQCLSIRSGFQEAIAYLCRDVAETERSIEQYGY